MNGLHKLVGGVGASSENTRNGGRRNIQFGSKVLLTETKVLHDLSYSVLHFTSLFEKSKLENYHNGKDDKRKCKQHLIL